MRKMLMLTVIMALSVAVQAKELTVTCESKKGNSLELITEIANIRDPQRIKSLVINGTNITKYEDNSSMPIYKNGQISLDISFGRMLYSSVSISVEDCDDDFSASGHAILKEYVGGFAGSIPAELNCSCSLK